MFFLVLWGLAHSGEEGVYNAIELLKNEFCLAMMLSGCTCIEVRALYQIKFNNTRAHNY